MLIIYLYNIYLLQAQINKLNYLKIIFNNIKQIIKILFDVITRILLFSL